MKRLPCASLHQRLRRVHQRLTPDPYVPTWGEILREVQAAAKDRGPAGPDLDGIRAKYVRHLRELSGRAVIVYASGWLQAPASDDPNYLVQPVDVHALMEVCHGVPNRELDLIIP